MTILRKSEIREMSIEQIDERLSELYTDIAKMKSQVRSGGAPENTGKIRDIRRVIARLKTIKREKNSKHAPLEEKKKNIALGTSKRAEASKPEVQERRK